MCKAFSCIVGSDKKVTWKLGVDSHTNLLKLTTHKDNTADPKAMTFARVEITPDNDNYFEPDKWSLRIDESITPAWWSPTYETLAWTAHGEWLRELDKVLVRKPIVHPFKIKPPVITGEHVALLKNWASVLDSVRDSVWDRVGDRVGASVRDSVRDSVWGSVWDSVWGSVGDSAWDSVGAYTGSFFNLWPKGYPFASAVTLWDAGLVPSFDGQVWRLHGGPKGKELFRITKEELNVSGA